MPSQGGSAGSNPVGATDEVPATRANASDLHSAGWFQDAPGRVRGAVQTPPLLPAAPQPSAPARTPHCDQRADQVLWCWWWVEQLPRYRLAGAVVRCSISRRAGALHLRWAGRGRAGDPVNADSFRATVTSITDRSAAEGECDAPAKASRCLRRRANGRRTGRTSAPGPQGRGGRRSRTGARQPIQRLRPDRRHGQGDRHLERVNVPLAGLPPAQTRTGSNR